MRVSVIMCVYKEPMEYLQLSLASILSQDFHFNEFIIVVDNPAHYEAIEHIKKLSLEDDRIKLLINKENKGLVYSLNKGLSIASCDYVVRMDADDISLSNRISCSIKYLIDNNLDIVGTKYIAIDQNNQEIPRIISKSYTSKKVMNILKFINIVPHPTWVCKKEVFNKLNNYRNINYAEDYDLLLRALNENFKIGIVDNILLQYRINQNGISQSNLFKQHLVARYLSKHRKKLKNINEDKVNNYINKRYSEKSKNKFNLAHSLFLEAKESFGVSNLHGVKCLIKSFLISKYYRQKFFNMLKKRLILLC